MIKRIKRLLPSALFIYLLMLKPILFEDISKIKCCDKYGKPLYYLLLIRISVSLNKPAYLINKIHYSSYKISYINKIFNILYKISYMLIKDIHLSKIRYIIYKLDI